MFPYRGLVVLIALCAFGAIQASFLGRDDYRRFKHGVHHGNFNASNSSGNWNATLPSGNYSHPGHFNSSGKLNSSRPIRSHGPHQWNSTFVGNSSSFSPRGLRKGLVFNRQPSYGKYNSSRVPAVNDYRPVYRPVVNSTWTRPAVNSTWSRPVNVPIFRPIYRPEYRPVYRPAVNSTWARPAVNSTWSRPGNSSWSG